MPLLALLVALQIIAPSRVWMTLLVGLGLTVAVSWVWARQMQKHVHLVRERRYTWARVGDRLEERFTLHNRSSLPVLWAEVRDESTLPGYRPGSVTGVGGSSSHRWKTYGVCRQRGVFTLGPTTLCLGDPFGLFSVAAHYPGRVPLLVMPATLNLPGIQVAPGGQLSEGRPRPHAVEPTTLAGSVRQYAAGDSLRWVHWPTSARRASWYVKTFDGSPAGAWWVILDLARNVHHGQGQTSTLEQGVTLAASLAEMGLRAGQAIGLVGHSLEPVWLPPRPDENQRWAVLRALATIEPGSRPLASLLQRVNGAIEQTASLVVITPDANPTWLEPLLLLRQRGLVPTVMLLTGQTGLSRMKALYLLLMQQGITSYLLEPDVLTPALAPAEADDGWEWRVTPLGRSIVIRRPKDAWKSLQ